VLRGPSPVALGHIATQFSFGVSFLLVGAVFIPSGIGTLFIPERLYDTSDSGPSTPARSRR
jgi:AAHS family cis,cis-muconate transporter-like MFS transporter